VRPASSLAAAAGLALAPDGGIEVDDCLQTSDPRVLAIGECASHRGTTYGLVPPAYRMADVAAERLLGGDAAFTGGDKSAKLKLLGVAVASLGRTDPDAASLTYRAPGTYRRLFLHRGQIVGAMAVGEWSDIDDVVQMIESKRRPSLLARRSFRRAGRVRRGLALRSSDPLVCACMRVHRSSLLAVVAEGYATADELSRRTGAGTLCGSCKPQLAALCDAVAAPRGQRSPGLLVGAIAAVAAMLCWAFAAPVAERLYAFVAARHTFWSQLTGYIALGLSLTGLSLSLRKRWRRFRLADYRHFRLIHVTVNVLALATLAAHTGLRLGDNLNRALLVVFLGTATSGVLAAVLSALGRTPRRAYWLHLLISWPLLGLLAAHIFHAYYY
jgi:bacterioferritin-associated ferredoxin